MMQFTFEVPFKFERIFNFTKVKDILIGERTLESRNGSVYYKAVLFAENVCYQDRFLVFEKDLMTLLEYFCMK